MRLKIRWRLTLWNTLALACVLVLFGGLVYWLLHRTRERIDHALEERVTHALKHIDQTLTQSLRQLQEDNKIHAEPVNQALDLRIQGTRQRFLRGVRPRRQGRVPH